MHISSQATLPLNNSII